MTILFDFTIHAPLNFLERDISVFVEGMARSGDCGTAVSNKRNPTTVLTEAVQDSNHHRETANDQGGDDGDGRKTAGSYGAAGYEMAKIIVNGYIRKEYALREEPV